VAAPPATAIFHRGDPKNPKATVGPADLTVLASFQKAPLGSSKPGATATGRRGDFARHLTSGKHPLATRVLANRIWHHHFGRGIVGTVADFGTQGDRPTHPELLDWLASELVAKNWSLKDMHRLLMNSAVYKQSSARTAEGDAVDPDNLLLSRASVRRLDAETLRFESLSLGLRTREGVPSDSFDEGRLRTLAAHGFVGISDGLVTLTRQGRVVADQVTTELL
jgi:hypothetical protein